MKPREFSALLLLAAIWGVSFLLIQIAAPILGPLTLVNARMLIASSVLLVYALMKRRTGLGLRQSWKAYLILGMLNSVLPMTLEAVAVMYLSPSLVAILVTTAPLFTALAAAVWMRESLTPTKLVGLLLGIAGVGVIVGWGTIVPAITVVLGIGAVLLAALFYALASIYAKVAFRATPALSLTIGQELLAGVVMLPLTLVNLPVVEPTVPVLAATLILALVMTAGGNLLYFYLIDHVGPTKTQSVAFLIPVFALLAGVMFLGEPITNGTLIGLGIIFAGVALVAEVGIRPVRLEWAALSLKSPRTALAGATPFPATVPSSTRPFRGWAIDGLPVYDRHSTRRNAARR